MNKKKLSKVMSEMGKKGAKALYAKLSPKQRSERARKASLARWGKKSK